MKKSDVYFWVLSLCGGGILSFISFFNTITFYNILFSIWLGLFISGIIMSVVSIVLAEMSVDDQGTDHIDHIDHDMGDVDHMDHVDLIDNIEHDVGHMDQIDIDHVDHVDQVNHIEHIDQELGNADHIDHLDHANPDHVDHINQFEIQDVTPAPFMLLFSSFLLFFGITGITFFFILEVRFRFLVFFITPAVSYTLTKLISMIWKKMAKSRYYPISATKNLIGIEGEVILSVDHRGGLVKIPSDTPMKFERIHVKPFETDERYMKGENVYICDFKDGFLLVSSEREDIKKYHQ
jgi:membrane protein implicated in regulation of membrane protease activity